MMLSHSCLLQLPDVVPAAEHLLAAFSLPEAGEGREYQHRRLDAFQACWDSLACHMEVSTAFVGCSSQTALPLPPAVLKALAFLQCIPQHCTAPAVMLSRLFNSPHSKQPALADAASALQQLPNRMCVWRQQQ